MCLRLDRAPILPRNHLRPDPVIDPRDISRNRARLFVPGAPLRTPLGEADPGTLGRMADDDIPLLPLRIGEGVVADDDARADCLMLILGDNPCADPWIVAGRD